MANETDCGDTTVTENKLESSTIRLLWKDRKRIFGLPITFTRYSMSDDRLFLETGLLNMKQEEVLLYRVRDISLRVSLGQRIFGVGTVCIQSSDKTIPHLDLQNVKRPRDVKEMIHRQVESMKVSRRMRVGEILEDEENNECPNEFDENENIG